MSARVRRIATIVVLIVILLVAVSFVVYKLNVEENLKERKIAVEMVAKILDILEDSSIASCSDTEGFTIQGNILIWDISSAMRIIDKVSPSFFPSSLNSKIPVSLQADSLDTEITVFILEHAAYQTWMYTDLSPGYRRYIAAYVCYWPRGDICCYFSVLGGFPSVPKYGEGDVSGDAPDPQGVVDRIYDALAQTGEPMLDHLIEAVADGTPYIREKSAYALGQTGDRRAVEPLIIALKDKNDEVREASVLALGEIGDTRAVEPLAEALCDEASSVREAAAVALGEIGDESAIKALVQALGNKESTHNKIRNILIGIGGPAVTPLSQALNSEDSDVRRTVVRMLWQIGKPAVESLIQALSNPDFIVRLTAVNALGEIGDQRATDHLIQFLSDKGSMVQAATIEALGEIGGSLAIKALSQALEVEEDPYRVVSIEQALEMARSKSEQE